jgi:hypothetical protein
MAQLLGQEPLAQSRLTPEIGLGRMVRGCKLSEQLLEARGRFPRMEASHLSTIEPRQVKQHIDARKRGRSPLEGFARHRCMAWILVRPQHREL